MGRDIAQELESPNSNSLWQALDWGVGGGGEHRNRVASRIYPPPAYTGHRKGLEKALGGEPDWCNYN